jgi:hypothetical protein
MEAQIGASMMWALARERMDAWIPMKGKGGVAPIGALTAIRALTYIHHVQGLEAISPVDTSMQATDESDRHRTSIYLACTHV